MPSDPSGPLGLFARKDVDALLAVSDAQRGGLRRALGPLQVTLLGVGAIIGAGIFTTIGTAAAGDVLRPGAGPSLMLSFMITAVVCGFTALCYAELAAMVPVSGSAYTYTYAALGELIAWVIGWDLMLEYAISNVAVAVSWANYFRAFLHGIGIDVPLWLAIDYRSATAIPGFLATVPHVAGVPIVLNLLAFSITAALTGLLVVGVRESARVNAVMVVVKILVLMLFVGACLAAVGPQQMVANWQPFAPQGWHGTFAAAAIVFFAYIGFDTVSTVAEETHVPGRTLPLGILASLAICTVLYVLVAGVFTGVVPFATMQAERVATQGEPLTMALGLVAPGSPWIATVVALGAAVAQTVTLLVYQMGQPRIFYAMARDGLLPPLFAQVHPRYRTPHVTTVLTGVLVACASTFLSIDELIDLTNIGTLFAFALVCLGIPVLRLVDADRVRPFRVPGGPLLLPLAGATCCTGLMWFLPSTSWWRFFGWLTAGLAVYAAYGYGHSALGRELGRRAGATAVRAAAGLALALVALGLFTVPHDQGVGAIWAAARTGRDPRAAWGLAAIAAGLAALGAARAAAPRRP